MNKMQQMHLYWFFKCQSNELNDSSPVPVGCSVKKFNTRMVSSDGKEKVLPIRITN